MELERIEPIKRASYIVKEIEELKLGKEEGRGIETEVTIKNDELIYKRIVNNEDVIIYKTINKKLIDKVIKAILYDFE